MADLVIKISGDVKDFSKALEEAEKKTEDLGNVMGTATKVAGVAFAALTAEVGLAISAFADSQAASNKLSQALQNQGLYTKDLIADYKSYASEVQRKTGLDDDSVVAAQASIQSLIGQQKVTQELTFAIADLSSGKEMDLTTTAELIGKGINGQTAALKKLGIEIDEHVSKEERTAQIIDQVNQKFGGMAEASNQGLGGIRGLKSAFGDLQESIGERFAPIFEAVIKKMTGFFQYINDNPAIVDLAVSIIAAGAAVTGLVTAIGAASTILLQARAAMTAMGIATSATGLAVKSLVGATGIGLLVLLVSEIALNWNSIWPRMQAVFQAFTENIGGLGSGLAKILAGVFTFNLDAIKAGLAEAKNAVMKGYDDYKAGVAVKLADIEKQEEESGEKQNATKARLAAEATAKQQEQWELEQELRDAESELKLAKAEEDSAAYVALVQAEVDTLKLLADEKFEGDKASLVARAEELRALQLEQKEIDRQQTTVFNQQIMADNEAFNAMSSEQQGLFLEQQGAKLQASLMTQDTARQKVASDRAAAQTKEHNDYLVNQEKFGKAYAEINQVVNSKEVQGAKGAFGELAQLQNSKSKELKAIGKAAAIAQITIKTAESAMNIYAGFSQIPIVGPALGIAGAAAAVAYGAEQVGDVIAADRGALVTGGIPGVDSVPVLAQQQELISPAQNFEEVIGSVRAKREAEALGGQFGIGAGGGSTNITIAFEAEAAKYLTVQQIENRALGTTPESAAVA